MTTPIPNLAGIAHAELVESIGGGNFSASYINWSRTMHLLRTHAPGWLPEIVHASDGGILHRAPAGGFLLLRFVHPSGATTPAVPQAIMDSRNAAIGWDKITARDITDTHRRGICMAAALTFGLAYELWAKIPLESGYAEQPETQADEGSSAEAADFAASIKAAESAEELEGIAAQLKVASLAPALLKGLRALYANRKATLTEQRA